MYYYNLVSRSILFFFNDTATTEIYTLSLHDALPICVHRRAGQLILARRERAGAGERASIDRKSTRLNSSHVRISYAVFCLKKKKKYILNSYIILYSILPCKSNIFIIYIKTIITPRLI